jgi:hypothetical protein
MNFAFQKGQDVIVIGSPGVAADVSLENAVSKGVVSTETTIDGETYRQLGISINPGNSGGPVIDGSGDVIGVVTLKAKEQEGLAFCIPFNELRTSMTAARQISKADQELGRSNHRARAVFFVIAIAGGLYEDCMGDFVDGMQAAIARGRRADDGLAEVRAKRGSEFSRYDLSIIKDVVSSVVSDRNLPESTRSKFADLWANLLELQDYVNSPHGSYNSYRAKLDQLTDTRHRLIGSLGLLVGK